ncbi:MAG: rRNA maturation RNase YbeY [Phycisphaerae bacterium]|nr:rRNA maturation RNase YbeY [Phycisphaerae bacterium]
MDSATPGMSMAAVGIADGTGRLSPELKSWLDRSLRRVVDHLGVGGECRIRIVADGEMATAHKDHLGVDGTTDVITFDLSDPSDAGSSLFLDVDLLVCLDEAERQHAATGVPVEHELLLYMVHGLLHCLGHDDHDDARSASMHALEDDILTAIGVGPVFKRPAGAPGGGVS